ncbi:MAG TPA: DUF1376 domain-containing protein [Porticoccus sp.]|nr:DUF1376 domain-containing protein [Porticoccus sp.]
MLVPASQLGTGAFFLVPIMTNKSPAFQFYPKDFISSFSVQTMTAEEVGIYTLLLCMDWLEDGIEDDLTTLEALFNHRLTDAQSLVKPWSKFDVCEDGRRRNKRLQEEREKQADWREKSSKGGKQSAISRRKITTLEPPLNHRPSTLKPKGDSSSSSSIASSSSNTKKKSMVIYDQDFETFWKAYPKKIGKGAANKFWEKQKPPLDKCLETIKAFIGSEQWKDPKYVPHPSTWLSQCRWDDEAPKKGKSEVDQIDRSDYATPVR